MSQSHSNNAIKQIQLNLFGSSSVDTVLYQNCEASDSSSSEAAPLTKKIALLRPKSNCLNSAYNLHHQISRRDESLPQQKHYELVMVDVKNLLASSNNKKFNGKEALTSLEIPSLQNSDGSKTTDFGRSLLAGVCTAYSTHFVLSG